MKFLRLIFSITCFTGFVSCISMPLLGQMKPIVPASSSRGIINGDDVLAKVGEKIITYEILEKEVNLQFARRILKTKTSR